MGEYYDRIADEDKFLSGEWPNARWELFDSWEMPPLELCTTSAVVPIMDIENGEVVLTKNNGDNPARRGMWEVPGGHRDRLDPADPESPMESPLQAGGRESIEETGFIIASAGLFACRRILNTGPADQGKYPTEAYSTYLWATTDQPLGEPTDTPKPTVEIFPLKNLYNEVSKGRLDASEFAIINRGFQAARRSIVIARRIKGLDLL